MKGKTSIDGGKEYLLSKIENSLCLGFHQLGHGPSVAWTTACIGSTLAEFNAIPEGMLDILLSLQWDCGGWSYNQHVPPDADTTLRVLQFLGKAGFIDQVIVERVESFVIAHQQRDGGIATYLPGALATLGYTGRGWTTSHPCVTALAAHVLQNTSAREKARRYIANRLRRGEARSYWWRTPWYVRYESGLLGEESIQSDPVEIGLALLLKARCGMEDTDLQSLLTNLQLADGSFPASFIFRIPRPHQSINDISGEEEIVCDGDRLFSTAAAIVAIARQKALRD